MDTKEQKSSGEQEEVVQTEKAKEYLKELMSEKLAINSEKNPNAVKLLEEEIKQVQATGKIQSSKFVNVYKEKPVKVVVKVLVPVKEHPRFNFVGKLLGPKGSSLKRLQEETMCKMAVFGRGSVKDKKKEEELRNSLDPKYSHLTDDLHVEISALAPPAEAYARIAFALAEIQKFLVPDEPRRPPFNEFEEFEPRMQGGPPPFRGGGPGGRGGPAHMGRGGPRAGGPPMRSDGPIRGPAPLVRPAPAKAKIMSILERARNAMDDYGSGGDYEDYDRSNGGYGGGYGGGYDDYGGGDYYGSDSYEQQQPRWKSGSSAMNRQSEPSRFRNTPYSRPGK